MNSLRYDKPRNEHYIIQIRIWNTIPFYSRTNHHYDNWEQNRQCDERAHWRSVKYVIKIKLWFNIMSSSDWNYRITIRLIKIIRGYSVERLSAEQLTSLILKVNILKPACDSFELGYAFKSVMYCWTYCLFSACLRDSVCPFMPVLLQLLNIVRYIILWHEFSDTRPILLANLWLPKTAPCTIFSLSSILLYDNNIIIDFVT